MKLRNIKKVLIANRGEIALRVIRACHSLGLQSVMVYSSADSNLLPVKLADESVCIGPADAIDSYLNIPAILSAAEVTDTDAIHPGYGFLSENVKFAEQVDSTGFIFIGPSAENIQLMGDKIAARKFMIKQKIDCVPGQDLSVNIDGDELTEIANKIGYPVILKSAGGGGGRGMAVVESSEDLVASFEKVSYEANLYFKNAEVYIEKYLQKTRHIECQIIADKYGNVQFLGTRDCSIQRRHQKLVEEAQAFDLSKKQQDYLKKSCIKVVKAMGYIGVGTFEFLLADGNIYFIEMNTRLQVEHTVTEMVFGVDLVEWQLRVARGESVADMKFEPKGFAIECRINAENPYTYMPSPGLIEMVHFPGGPGVRIDSHIYSGYRVPANYDSLIAKLITYGDNREHAIMRMRQALDEFVIKGIDSNIELYKKIMSNSDYQNANISTDFIDTLDF